MKERQEKLAQSLVLRVINHMQKLKTTAAVYICMGLKVACLIQIVGL